MPFYTVTSVTLSRLNSINAIDVKRYLEACFGLSSQQAGKYRLDQQDGD